MNKYELICSKFESYQSVPMIDLCFCDPPDNLGVNYENCADKWDDFEYADLLDRWIQKCCAITKGPVFFSFNEKWTGNVEWTIKTRHISLIQRCYWKYNFGQNQSKKYTPCMRPIYWLNSPIFYPDVIKVPSARQIKYHDKRAKDGGRVPDNVWEYSRVCGTFKEKRKWHCNQHPEALLKQIILGHSMPEQTIFDPFVGSGTSAYVSLENNRNFIGLDCSQFYLDKIQEEITRRELK